ncbi:PREDICTED: A-kinase-interacting protein 1 isoform X2 [Cyprinodon variegatus]|uniref:A-kinase interacting protein 1 n=2 Tax=Cyprinodon variegatus TaxID=28743 RepID=A0A3Q2E7P3_CYPVA|nr:PREDICTED: A-kinase-interacting protein 1 isoform X2 [Cyprinodon variegatus]
MARQAWLDSSLRRSGRLGLEVLERASRRSVDWTSTAASQTPSSEDDFVAAKRKHDLHDAFTTIADFMAKTSFHCKRFYESGSCTEPSDAEKNHISRFHTRPGAGPTSALPRRKSASVSATGEDFYIEVSPGTYAITASLPDSQRQTKLVSIKPGESVDLTFNL